MCEHSPSLWQHEVFQELERRDLQHYVQVEPLADAEIGAILDGWLCEDRRALTDAQRCLVLDAAGERPTSLKLKALQAANETLKKENEELKGKIAYAKDDEDGGDGDDEKFQLGSSLKELHETPKEASE